MFSSRTGFIKARNLEVGERISSFHKNLNECAEAVGSYLVSSSLLPGDSYLLPGKR